jgi:CRP-like cAMP-binding protein
VLADPKPYVFLRNYGDFAIEYALHFFVDDLAGRERIEAQVNNRVWYQLKRDGLSVPFPIRDLNLRLVSPDDDVAEATRRTKEITTALGQVPFLEPLSDEERQQLASQIRTEFYAGGEVIISQGQPGSSFFLIGNGEVSVRTEQPGQPPRHIATLGRYNWFGERSLMTGEERSATVVASRDTEIYVIDKEAFQGIISANDALVEAISERLVAREQELVERREAAEERTAGQAAQDEKRSLIQRIRRWFS